MKRRPLHSLSAAFAVGAFVAAMAVVVAIIAGAGGGLSDSSNFITLGEF